MFCCRPFQPWFAYAGMYMKLLAELFSTFFLLFAGMGAIVVNGEKKGAVTFPGITVVWGMAVMVMAHTVGHTSGAHMTPAVPVGFAIARRFPWRRVSVAARSLRPVTN